MHSPFKASISWILGAALIVLVQGTKEENAQTAASVRTRGEAPVAVWPAGPLDVVAAFDEPVDPVRAKTLVGQSIAYFALCWPKTARWPSKCGVQGRFGSWEFARATPDERSFIATDPHPRKARYVLPLGELRVNDDPGSRRAPGSSL